MGERANLPAVFEQEEDPSSRSFFSEIISSISDVRFSYDGRYILSRDYLTVKIWDVNMERQPIKTIPIHEHLRPRLCDTYENDSIFDKFEVFFSGDGKTIWYDLQTPKSQVFWVAGYHTVTGQRTQYYVPREEWSVHFNVSLDGKLFAGDGGGPNSVAAPGNGQWIYLFRPEELPDSLVAQLPNPKEMIMPGRFKTEKLVNLAKHDYSLEPNVTFSPDMKWVVFRSNARTGRCADTSRQVQRR